jgi:hypothetical protein
MLGSTPGGEEFQAVTARVGLLRVGREDEDRVAEEFEIVRRLLNPGLPRAAARTRDMQRLPGR